VVKRGRGEKKEERRKSGTDERVVDGLVAVVVLLPLSSFL
jgi:hypothetical protein